MADNSALVSLPGPLGSTRPYTARVTDMANLGGASWGGGSSKAKMILSDELHW